MVCENKLDDLAVGSVNYSEHGIGKGAIHILLMESDGTVKSANRIDEDELSGGPLPYSALGDGAAWLGDLDGPGGKPGALAVGAGASINGGAVLILYLN